MKTLYLRVAQEQIVCDRSDETDDRAGLAIPDWLQYEIDYPNSAGYEKAIGVNHSLKKPMNKQTPAQLYPEDIDMELVNQPDQKKAYQLCLEFLKGVEKSKRMNYQHNSYGYKHMVEDGRDHYVYEGTFILAALEAGFTMKQRYPGCSALFNVKERSLMKRIREWTSDDLN